MYVWVDGIHLKVRLAQDKVCLLVMIGVRADGAKELIALDDRHRESAESWADLLRSYKRRGMRAPVLAVGDGAVGFWKALRDVFADTKEQRCWWHRTREEIPCRCVAPEEWRCSSVRGRPSALSIKLILHGFTRSATSSPRSRSRRTRTPRPRWRRSTNAEDRGHAEPAAKAFAAAYGAKWPKAVAKITNDLDVLLAFYDFPGEHWIHLRTTNPTESTFATVRLRQRVTKGPGSRAAAIAMAFKLIESAQHRWRAVNSAHLVAGQSRREVRERRPRRSARRINKR